MALRLPGIVVRTPNSVGIIAPPLFERYPVIIGEGDPYRIIRNQRVVRSLGSIDSIRSITTVNEIVSVGDLPGVSNYTGATDYNLVANQNAISWVPGGTRPTLGDSYYITFTETRPASAYTPTLYFDENLIYTDHGEAARTDGSINDASVGGSLALNAGGRGVIIAQLNLSAATDPDNPTNAELEAAFIVTRNQLDVITDYKLLLTPMSSGTLNTTTAANIFFNHAVLASEPENKQERTCMAALATGTSYGNAATFAQTYAHERMIVPYAFQGQSRSVGYGFAGWYDMRFYNAALAGKLCSVPIGIEIADEIIPNVMINDNQTPEEFTFLVQRGVSPAKVRGDVVRNIMAITTDTTSALTESLGVQDIKDYVKKYWREGLWNAFRNKPINADLLGQIKSASEGILEYLESREVVSEWRRVAVAQNELEPRQVDVTGQIVPAFGLTWMDVTFTFNLSFS